MQLSISSFGGIIPKYSPHQLSATSASVAHNVKLRNGRLEPWKELCPFAKVQKSNVSFYVRGCCSFAWDEHVTAADVSADWGRFFISGRKPYAEVVTVDCKCKPTYYRLGVPAPNIAPAISGTEVCNRAAGFRNYVYTYVNIWGEESAPSPPSKSLLVEDGEVVHITGLTLPPDGYGIEYINLYRIATGGREPNAKTQKPVTGYSYVTTIQLPSTSFEDIVKEDSLGAMLETEDDRVPPHGLQNITSIGSVVRLAGTFKNKVFLSENLRTYSWPVKYEMTLDSTIIHMGCLEQTLFVTTDTTPYVIDVSSCEDMKCTPVLDTGIKLPDIACHSASSAIITPHGFIYCSPLGLVLIDPGAKYHILTNKWFSADDWAQIEPHTARLGYWQGFLFCITNTTAFILNIDGAPYGDLTGGELTTISDFPIDLKTNSVGQLFMLSDGEIKIWNAGDRYREFTWISRELINKSLATFVGQPSGIQQARGSLWSPASIKIGTKHTKFTLISPWSQSAYSRSVFDETPFRVPRVGRHLWFKVSLQGTEPVEFLDIGTAHFTVNAGS